MANFKVKYYSTGSISFDALEKDMQPENKLAILRPAAALLLQRLREFLAANTCDPNKAVRGRLAESLTAAEISAVGSIIVTPRGVHHASRGRGNPRAKAGRRLKGSKTHHGMTGATTAAEVGYYLEYGTSRMAALHWMETVNEQSAEEIQAALEKAWDEYLTSLGL